MTVITSQLTEEHSKLLGAFLEAQKNAVNAITEYANAYKACTDAGMDMGEYVDKDVEFRLLKIAEGKLVPKKMVALLALPSIAIERLATLPKADQEKAWNEGVPVWRNDKPQTLALHDINPQEFRRAIDTTGGRGRFVAPHEQQMRAEPRQPPKRDQEVLIRLSYDERNAMGTLAQKKGVSIPAMIKLLVRDACDLE